MRRVGYLWLLAAILAGGCNRYYVIAAPEIVAPAGGEAPAIVRLQRIDPYYFTIGVKGAVMAFRLSDRADRPWRGSYTDQLGYAGVALPAPSEPGRYPVTISHSDKDGDEVSCQVPLFVFPADKPAVAVDLDGIAKAGFGADSKAALTALARTSSILYMTRTDLPEHPGLHARLTASGHPDGPILPWQQENYHIVRDGPYGMPRLIVETRLVSQLTNVKKSFARLRTGVCDTDLAAKAFKEAGLNCVMIGPGGRTWQDIAQKGL